MQKMTALVTGATGFLGSAVVRQLLARGDAVRVLARMGSDRRNLTGLDVEIIEGDLDRPETLPPAVKGIDALYHVAADYRLWVRDEAAMLRTNVEGSRALIRAAAGAGASRIVYTSSVAALGVHKDGTASNEESPVSLADMVGIYKRSKFLAEEAVRALVAQEKAPVVIVNPSTPIGPRDIKPTPTGRIIVEAASGKMPAFVDTGLNIAHVDDVAAGHVLAHDHGQIGERYILGGEDMALKDILAIICTAAGRKPPTVELPVAAVMPIAYAAEAAARLLPQWEPFVTVDSVRMARKKMFFSSRKAQTQMGYRSRPARDALIDAFHWFRDQGYVSARGQGSGR
jgi:dihydroflavonol-4-reductase